MNIIKNHSGHLDRIEQLNRKNVQEYADSKQSKPPSLGEISYTRSDWLDKYGVRSYNPDDLVGKKGLEIYHEMAHKDDMVKSALAIRKFAIIQAGWDIKAASDSNADQQIAQFVKDVLKMMNGTVSGFLYNMLTGIEYGFSVTEKVWKIIDSGEHKGKIGLKKLATRPPFNFEFEDDGRGNLSKIIQTIGFTNDIAITPEKVILYSHMSEFSNHYGQSDLRPAYKYYWAKDNVLKFWLIFLERFGMGSLKVETPSMGLGPNEDDILDQIIRDYQAQVGIKVPKGVELEILEATRSGNGEYKPALEHFDKGIAKSMFIPETMGLSERKTGSYNLGKEQKSVFEWATFYVMECMEDRVNEDLIRQVVDHNFANVDRYPTFSLGEISDDDLNEWSTIIQTLCNTGFVNPQLKKDIDYFRQKYDLPDLTPEEFEKYFESKERPLELQEPEEEKEESKGKKKKPVKNSDKTKVQVFGDEDYHRTLTEYEKRMDFSAIEKFFDSTEDDAYNAVYPVFEKIRETAIKDAKRFWNGSKTDLKQIENFKLNHAKELAKVLTSYVLKAKERGYNDVARELSKANKFSAGYNTEKYILSKLSFAIRFEALLPLEKEIIFQLYEGFKAGETNDQLIYRFNRAFEGYFEPAEFKRAHRVETLVRTTISEAINEGRWEMANDKDVKDIVVGYMLSAILDSRTTQVCRAWDGLVFPKDDPIWNIMRPPNHYNCRTLLVIVTKYDSYTFATQYPEERPAKRFH